MRARTAVLAMAAAAVFPLGSVCVAAAMPKVAAAAGSPIPDCAGFQSRSANGDVDGDGSADYVVGVPRATSAGRAAAGAVDVHFASTGNARTQRVDQSFFSGLPAPAAGDAFGSYVAFAHLASDPSVNPGEQCADLAIGARGENSGRGAVVIAQGSHTGISASRAIRLTGRTAGEQFGSRIVSYGTDVWISAPYRTVDGVPDAGAVDQYRIAGGTATLVQTLTENTPGIPGGAEPGDRFGEELDMPAAGPLIVGEPAEDVGSHAVDAGTVTVVWQQPSGAVAKAVTYSQNTPGIPGVAEAGDHFGVGVTSDDHPYGDGTVTGTGPVQIAVGVPGETIGSARATGTVDTFTVTESSPTLTDIGAVSQDSAGVPGADESYDQFGRSVALVAGGLCIGIPGEDIGSVIDAGRVVCGTIGSDWTEPAPGGSAQTGAAVGTQLSRFAASSDPQGDQGGEYLLVAVPGANAGASKATGRIVGLDGRPVTDSAGPIANERYGVLATTWSAGPSYSISG